MTRALAILLTCAAVAGARTVDVKLRPNSSQPVTVSHVQYTALTFSIEVPDVVGTSAVFVVRNAADAIVISTNAVCSDDTYTVTTVAGNWTEDATGDLEPGDDAARLWGDLYIAGYGNTLPQVDIRVRYAAATGSDEYVDPSQGVWVVGGTSYTSIATVTVEGTVSGTSLTIPGGTNVVVPQDIVDAVDAHNATNNAHSALFAAARTNATHIGGVAVETVTEGAALGATADQPGHTQAISTITGLQTALDVKAATTNLPIVAAGTGGVSVVASTSGTGRVTYTVSDDDSEPIAAAHLADTTDAHDASAISGSGTYTDVQSAVTAFEALKSYLNSTATLTAGTTVNIPGTCAQYTLTSTQATTLSLTNTAPRLGFTITRYGTNSLAFPASWTAIDSGFTVAGTNVISVWPKATTNWYYLAVGVQ